MKVIDEIEFEKVVKEEKKVVLIDFFATWCGPCRMLSSVLEELEEEYSDKLKCYKIDVDKSLDLARKFGVMSVPSVFVYDAGKQVNKFIGFREKDAIIQEIEAYLK